jgi:hypothetical protein
LWSILQSDASAKVHNEGSVLATPSRLEMSS